VALGAVAAGGALLISPPAASAAVRIGHERIVVTSSAGRVAIVRRPFSLVFRRRGHGAPVLSEVANTGQSPLVVPPTPSPTPIGQDRETRPTLYAPLVFTVGAARDFQYPGAQWNGNELSGTEAGTQYSAREVTSVQRSGAGVRLVVSTSDPSGRVLSVSVAPVRGGSFTVRVRPSPAEGVATMGDAFASPAGEAFHGFGGRHNALDQRGQDFYNWVEQQNVGAGGFDPLVSPVPGSGGHGYLFPNGPTAAYYVQSQFVSRGYGFLLDRDEISRWRLASDRPNAWTVSAAAPALDYVVAPGRPLDAMRRLTALTGRQAVPPAWALGPMLDRLVRFPDEGAKSYQSEVEDDLRHIRAGDIRVTGYRIEGWHYYDGDPGALRSVIRRLHALGVHALVYFRAFETQGRSGTGDASAYDEAVQRGYAARTPSGQPYVFPSNFNTPAVLLDFTNPATVRSWQRRLRQALDLGADGFMQDFGEQVQVDMRFHDGSTGARMHNRYPVLFHRATRRVLDRYRREHTGRRLFFYTRAGYSGTPGAARYEQSNFPGDETTDWSRSSGLASLTTDMLNRAVGGAYGFNTDVGGYFDIGPYPKTTKELFIRWAEWAALSPVMRLHGAISTGTHTPWSFDAQTVRVYRSLSRLHERARPLIARLWRAADRTGIPPTRPLWLSEPGDPAAAAQDQEWLLGPDVLVAPVVAEGATKRSVYFPRGCWKRPSGGERHRGPGSATVSAPLTRLPYFFRCGTRPFAAARRPAARPHFTG